MEFSEVMAALEVVDGRGRGQVPADWMQGRTAFGGLLAALAGKALRTVVPAGLPLRQLQVAFVGPVAAGAVTVEARLLRAGRSVAQAECRIVGDASPATVVLGTYGVPRRSSVVREPDRATVPDSAAARAWPFVPGVTPVFTRHMGMRWAGGAMPFEAGAEPRTRILLRHEDPAALTEAHVIALADSIPPPALSVLARPAPASSLTWSLEFLRHDFDLAPGRWWYMDAQVTAGGEGYLFQTARLYDPDGRAFACNRQLVAVFDG